MSGWKIVEGITFTFPSGATIAPGAYVILARDSVRFKADNGFDPHFDWGGSDNGALSNSGEDITLVNSSSVTVDSVDYDDGSGSGNGWGTSSSGHDGTGPSLELKDFSKNNVGGDNSDGFWGISSGKGSPNKINTNFNGTVWKSTLASDDKPIRTIPAGTWTQDAKPVINSLADFPAKTLPTGNIGLTLEVKMLPMKLKAVTLSIKVALVKTHPMRTFLIQMVT